MRKPTRKALALRLALVAIVACLAGSLAGTLFVFAGGEPFSFADLLGFASLSFVAALLLCAILYAPALALLRHRLKGRTPTLLFLSAPLLLNVPLFLLLLAAARSGGFFSGAGEVAVFAVAFATTGALFGLGFVWSFRRARASHA